MSTIRFTTQRNLNSLNTKNYLYISIVALVASACTGIKPYQRAYLNDSQMQSGALKAESFEQDVFNYREGAMSSGTQKGKGGCGCN